MMMPFVEHRNSPKSSKKKANNLTWSTLYQFQSYFAHLSSAKCHSLSPSSHLEDLLEGGPLLGVELLAVLLLHGPVLGVDVAEDEVELGVGAATVRPEHDRVRGLGQKEKYDFRNALGFEHMDAARLRHINQFPIFVLNVE